MNKHSRKDVVFIDIESSGLDTRRDCCIEIAAIRCTYNGKKVTVWDTKIVPACPVNSGAAAINGFNTRDWANSAHFHCAMVDIYNKVLDISATPYQFVSWFDFDFKMIARQCEDTRIPSPLGVTPCINAADVLFPLVLSERVPTRKLADAAAYLGITPRGEHRALVDAETLMLVWFEYLKKCDLAWCTSGVAQSAINRMKEWLSR